MAATCSFCDQDFANAQAVRAHLKSCSAYNNRREAAPALGNGPALGKSLALGRELPIGSGRGLRARDESDSPDFDPVKQLERQVASGRLRLTLREIDDAHAELDRKRAVKEGEQRREAERQAELQRQAQSEVRAKQEREAAAAFRRRVIQDVKRQVMSESFYGQLVLDDVRADVAQAVEHALAALPVDDLPHEELLLVARAARDHICNLAEQEQREKRDATWKALRRDQERAERKRQLIDHGREYARRELSELDVFDRLHFMGLVERELQDIEGDEERADIENRIEDIFDHEGLEDESDEDED